MEDVSMLITLINLKSMSPDSGMVSVVKAVQNLTTFINVQNET